MIQTNLLGRQVRITNPHEDRRKRGNAIGEIVTAMLCGNHYSNEYYTILFSDGSLVDFQPKEFRVIMDTR